MVGSLEVRVAGGRVHLTTTREEGGEGEGELVEGLEGGEIA